MQTYRLRSVDWDMRECSPDDLLRRVLAERLSARRLLVFGAVYNARRLRRPFQRGERPFFCLERSPVASWQLDLDDRPELS
jgi:hypothetical protein